MEVKVHIKALKDPLVGAGGCPEGRYRVHVMSPSFGLRAEAQK